MVSTPIRNTEIPIPAVTQEAWQGFQPGTWVDTIDVRDFIQRNYAPYM